MLAFVLVTGIGVILGSKFIRLLPVRYLRIGTAALFILFGVIFIINFVTGSSLI
jgi:putative Ca2+/H+ antiporter (TMEM165/GDT1 family)